MTEHKKESIGPDLVNMLREMVQQEAEAKAFHLADNMTGNGKKKLSFSEWLSPSGIGTVLLIAGLFSGSAYTYWNDKSETRRQSDLDRAAVSQGLQSLHGDIVGLRSYVDDKFKDSDVRRDKYVPIIETDKEAVELLKQRIEALSESARIDRDRLDDVSKLATATREDIAVIKTQLSINAKPDGKRGELIPPERVGMQTGTAR